MSLEQTYTRLISGQLKGVVAGGLRAALCVPAWIYQSVMGLRNLAYERGIFQQHQVPVPVISVGNIVLGGTGKTPITLHLGEYFSQSHRTAILSRGYRSSAEKKKEVTVLSRGEGPVFDAEQCGDEPYLLAKHIPEAIVIVGRDRVAAAKEAVRLGAEVILLDDGMQHRRLRRTLDIVVMDAHQPFGFSACFPRGLLREPLTELKRAGLVVLTHCEPSDCQAIADKLARYTDAAVVTTQFVAEQLEGPEGPEPADLCGRKVGVFCGVAKPSSVLQSLRKMGAMVVARLELSDHKAPTAEQLRALADTAIKREASFLICTEKDAVKLSPSQFKLSPLPIRWVKRRLHIEAEDGHRLKKALRCSFSC